jgi:hypothetical protein
MARTAGRRGWQRIKSLMAGSTLDVLPDVLSMRKIKRLTDLRRPPEIKK